MDDALRRYLPLPARVMLSFIFVSSGANKVMDWSGTAAYMEGHGMPAVPFFLLMAICFQVGGGLMVLTGFRARLGAAALIVFLIPATLIFHAFWAVPEEEQQQQMIHFMKNLSILGGLLMVAGLGAGGCSFDARRGG